MSRSSVIKITKQTGPNTPLGGSTQDNDPVRKCIPLTENPLGNVGSNLGGQPLYRTISVSGVGECGVHCQRPF